jgi:hypothetical protein
MNRITISASHAPLSLLTAEQDQTEHHQTPDAGFTADFQELCSLAMDQALGMEKASLDAATRMQSFAIGILEHASWSISDIASDAAPARDNLFDFVAQTVLSCLQLQLYCLAMMSPHVIERIDTSLPLAASCGKAANRVRSLPRPPAEGAEHHMDIAIGARAAEPVLVCANRFAQKVSRMWGRATLAGLLVQVSEHLGQLFRQGFQHERLLQVFKLRIDLSLPGQRVLGVAGHEHHAQLR